MQEIQGEIERKNLMDYTDIYENIINSGITNFDESYILYYDETNNPRKFCLTQEGFNVNEREFFILGGVGFENTASIENLEIDKLLCDFKIQKNTNEMKFKHIKCKSKNLTELIIQKRVQILIDWIIEKNAFIHYSYIDNFYYSIVDIVDTVEQSFWIGPEFQREIKDSLYSLIKKIKRGLLTCLSHMTIQILKIITFLSAKLLILFVGKILMKISNLNI